MGNVNRSSQVRWVDFAQEDSSAYNNNSTWQLGMLTGRELIRVMSLPLKYTWLDLKPENNLSDLLVGRLI
jgi:hypothetical protein